MTDYYISIANGVRTERPKCFKCGDCCSEIPVELMKEEVELLARHLHGVERKLFLASITTDFQAANVLPKQLKPRMTGIGWLKAPCMFLKYHRGKARCKIYHIRPIMCQTFWCGRTSTDQPLTTTKYTLKLSTKVVGDEMYVKVIEAYKARGIKENASNKD